MDVATGRAEGHESLLPLDESQSPALARPTSIASGPSPVNQVGVFDATAEQSGRLSGYEADCRAAQATGQNARNSMLAAYEAGIRPLGAMYGDQPQLPVVPDNAVPPSSSFLYPFSGDEPVPAAGYHGDEPG